MSEESVCPNCNSPIRRESDASLTQWILSCACEKSRTEPLQSSTIDLCTQCGKRRSAGTDGSFTQLIFSSELCSCHIENTVQQIPEPAPIVELELNIPFPLDRYAPISKLGSGGLGDVFLARDRLLKKDVAVKVLHELDDKRQMAFQNEAKATSKLKHTSIVEVLNFGTTESGAPYMVLEYVEGKSLREVIQENKVLELPYATAIFEQLCLALSYAHAQGIFHRDIQPNNILITFVDDELIVKIIDFGMSTINQETEEIAGSPLYMSPDGGLGHAYDARSETYSLGCLLYEMLSGRPPLQGDTPLHTLYMQANQVPLRLSEVSETLKIRELDEILARALEKDPDMRFQSAKEFGAALDALTVEEHEATDELEAVIPQGENFSTTMILICIAIVGVAFSTYFIVSTETAKKPTETVNSDLNKMDVGNTKTDKKLVKKVKKKVKQMAGSAKEVSPFTKSDDLLTGRVDLDETIKDVSHYNDIQTLEIVSGDSDHHFTGRGLKYLSANPLRDVTIQSDGFDDAGIEELTKFKTIKKLQLNGAIVTAKGLAKLGTLPLLRRLTLKDMTMSRDMFAALLSIKGLEQLSLADSRYVDQKDFKLISKIRTLQLLNVSTSRFNDEGVDTVADGQFGSFYIENTEVTDKGLMVIANKMKKLKVLRINQPGTSGLSQAGCAEFEKLRPDVELKLTPGIPIPTFN